MNTVMSLYAHPDDETTFAGTLWLLKERYHIHLLCLTRGERGLSSTGEVQTGQIREQEERALAAMLGADVTFLDQMDGEVYAHREVCERVAGIVRQVRPIAFIGMWPIDAHPDHTAASEIARKALFHAKYDGELYMTEGVFCQTAYFDPDIFVDISDVMEPKRRLIRCHACQNRDDHLVAHIEKNNSFRGEQIRRPYAECFKKARPFINTDSSIFWGLIPHDASPQIRQGQRHVPPFDRPLNKTEK